MNRPGPSDTASTNDAIRGGTPLILVFGAGAIGQWIGARFAQAGARVTLLCRKAAYDAVRAHGLRVRDAAGQAVDASSVTAVDTLAALEGTHFDWIFVTVKAFDVADALRELGQTGLLGGDTAVMGFQNGVGTEDAIAAAVGPERTYVCVVTRPIGLTDTPGEVEEASAKGGISVAPYQRGRRLGSLEPLLRRCAMPVTRFDDQRAMKWSKLLLNMTANAICALVDCTAAELYANPALFRVERSAFEEAVSVMRALHLRPANLPGYPAKALTMVMRLPPAVGRAILRKRVGGARGSKQPSLRLEMQRPRPQSEVHWLNGAVVSQARALGLKAPANAFLTETLSAIVEGRTPWDTYRHHPQRFVEAFREATR